MNKRERTWTYIGGKYHHAKSGFTGVVVGEFVPVVKLPEMVLLILKSSNGERKRFPLSELVEIE